MKRHFLWIGLILVLAAIGVAAAVVAGDARDDGPRSTDPVADEEPSDDSHGPELEGDDRGRDPAAPDDGPERDGEVAEGADDALSPYDFAYGESGIPPGTLIVFVDARDSLPQVDPSGLSLWRNGREVAADWTRLRRDVFRTTDLEDGLYTVAAHVQPHGRGTHTFEMSGDAGVGVRIPLRPARGRAHMREMFEQSGEKEAVFEDIVASRHDQLWRMPDHYGVTRNPYGRTKLEGIGNRTLHLVFRDAEGRPVTGEQLYVFWRQALADMEPWTPPVREVAPGHYVARECYPGKYRIWPWSDASADLPHWDVTVAEDRPVTYVELEWFDSVGRLEVEIEGEEDLVYGAYEIVPEDGEPFEWYPDSRQTQALHPLEPGRYTLRVPYGVEHRYDGRPHRGGEFPFEIVGGETTVVEGSVEPLEVRVILRVKWIGRGDPPDSIAGLCTLEVAEERGGLRAPFRADDEEGPEKWYFCDVTPGRWRLFLKAGDGVPTTDQVWVDVPETGTVEVEVSFTDRP